MASGSSRRLLSPSPTRRLGAGSPLAEWRNTARDAREHLAQPHGLGSEWVPTRWRTPSPSAAMTGGGAAPYRTRRGWTCVRPKSLRNAFARRHIPLARGNPYSGARKESPGPAQEGFWGLRGRVPPQAGPREPTRRPVLPGPIEGRQPGLSVSTHPDTWTVSPYSPSRAEGEVRAAAKKVRPLTCWTG